jgi:hypothetical protein
MLIGFYTLFMHLSQRQRRRTSYWVWTNLLNQLGAGNNVSYENLRDLDIRKAGPGATKWRLSTFSGTMVEVSILPRHIATKKWGSKYVEFLVRIDTSQSTTYSPKFHDPPPKEGPTVLVLSFVVNSIQDLGIGWPSRKSHLKATRGLL